MKISRYDFEGGTFYHYLLKDSDGVKAFVYFNDIDPIQCTFDDNDTFWFKNIKPYLPKGNKTKRSKQYQKDLFKSNQRNLALGAENKR